MTGLVEQKLSMLKTPVSDELERATVRDAANRVVSTERVQTRARHSAISQFLCSAVSESDPSIRLL